jgi:hypothetical protein
MQEMISMRCTDTNSLQTLNESEKDQLGKYVIYYTQAYAECSLLYTNSNHVDIDKLTIAHDIWSLVISSIIVELIILTLKKDQIKQYFEYYLESIFSFISFASSSGISCHSMISASLELCLNYTPMLITRFLTQVMQL